MNFKHILVTTDLSDAAERAFPYAEQLAKEAGARLTLLHIVEASRVVPHGAPFAPAMPAPSLDGVIDSAKIRCAKQAACFSGVGEVKCIVLLAGEVGYAICDAARTHGCDLIVLSTHGRSGFKRLMLGSVAESVLRHAHVPVLCVPMTESAEPVL